MVNVANVTCVGNLTVKVLTQSFEIILIVFEKDFSQVYGNQAKKTSM